MLGAVGLTAYGWRGGLAGAAVGLLHVERIDTRSLSYYRRTRGQGREAWNPEARIGRVRDWFFNFRLAAGDPGSSLDALPVTVGVAATVGVLLGSSGRLVSRLTYGVATAVAVLTAVILCIGYGYTIRDMQSVAPREGRKLDLAPLPLRPFLDYATQCLFLRQVGDGYLFVHLSLLEFFADMWELGDVAAERLDALAPR